MLGTKATWGGMSLYMCICVCGYQCTCMCPHMCTTGWGFDEAVSQGDTQKLGACRALTSTLGCACGGVRRSLRVCLNVGDCCVSYSVCLTLSELVVASAQPHCVVVTKGAHKTDNDKSKWTTGEQI